MPRKPRRKPPDPLFFPKGREGRHPGTQTPLGQRFRSAKNGLSRGCRPPTRGVGTRAGTPAPLPAPRATVRAFMGAGWGAGLGADPQQPCRHPRVPTHLFCWHATGTRNCLYIGGGGHFVDRPVALAFLSSGLRDQADAPQVGG